MLFINKHLSRKLRQKDTSKHHIQLSLAVLFSNIMMAVLMFLSTIDNASIPIAYYTALVLLVYFILVAIMWMAAEALLIFQKLVIIFTETTRKYTISASIFCWSKLYVYSIQTTATLHNIYRPELT